MPLICSLCTALFDDLGDSYISYVVSSAQNGLLRNTEKKIETEVFCITVSLCAYTKIVAVEGLVLLGLGCGAGEGWQERVAGRMWMGCQKVLWLVEPGSVEWVTWRDGRSISGKEQAGKSAVREGLPGPGPASGHGTGCLIAP